MKNFVFLIFCFVLFCTFNIYVFWNDERHFFRVLKTFISKRLDVNADNNNEQALVMRKLIQNMTKNDTPINRTIISLSKDECIDPTNDELQHMLDTYIEKEQYLEQEDVEDYFNDELEMYGSVSDQSDCKITKLQGMQRRTPCPYTFEIKERTNRFPKYIVSVKCTCNLCRSLNGDFFQPRLYDCAAKYEKRIVLKRGACGENHIYQWVYGIEFIPRMCDCKLKRKITTF